MSRGKQTKSRSHSTKKTKKKTPKHRLAGVESLDSRIVMSVTPLTTTLHIDNENDGVIDSVEVTSRTFDEDGNQVAQDFQRFDGSNNPLYSSRSTWEFDEAGNETFFRTERDGDADGNLDYVQTRIDAYDAPNSLTSSRIATDADGDGNLDSVVENSFEYDEYGNQVTSLSETDNDANGSVDRTTVTRAVYDAEGNQLSYIYESDATGDGIFENRSEIRRNANGIQLYRLTESDRNGDGIIDERSEYVRDDEGRLLLRVDQPDRDRDGVVDSRFTYEYAYDESGNQLSRTCETDYGNDGSIDSRSEDAFTYDDSGNQLSSTYELDSDGDGNPDERNVSNSVYDDRGNRISYTYEADYEADGQIDRRRVETSTYDDNGNVSSTHVAVDDDGDGQIDSTSSTTSEFDSLGGRTSYVNTSDFDADGEPDYVYQEFREFDAVGNLLTARTERDTNGDGQFSVRLTTNFYDTSQRLVQIVNENYGEDDGTLVNRYVNTIEYGEDGSVVLRRETADYDADGVVDYTRTETWQPDVNGTIYTSVVDANGDSQADSIYVTQQLYDENGNQLYYRSESDQDADGILESRSFRQNVLDPDGRSRPVVTESFSAGRYGNYFEYIYDDEFRTIGTVREQDADGDGQVDYRQTTETDFDAFGNSIRNLVETDSDGDGIVNQSVLRTWTYTYELPNEAPSATLDFAVISQGQSASVDVIANDVDPNADDTLGLADSSVTIVSITRDADGAQISQGDSLASQNGDSVLFDSGSAFQMLPEGETATVEIEYVVTDDATDPLTDVGLLSITVVGENDEAVILGGVNVATVEDTALVSATARIEDLDAGEAAFVPQANVSGDYGVFGIGENGNWTYDLNNDITNALAEGEIVSDAFAISSVDATATAFVTVTINGRNDPAIITGTPEATVSEDDATLLAGTLNVVDPDKLESGFETQASVEGQFGVFSISETGAWTYQLDTELVQQLNFGAVEVDEFPVRSLDGTATTNVSITINGENDEAQLSGGGEVLTDEDNTSSIDGNISVADLDAGEAFVLAYEQTGNFGSFSINEAGDWSYLLDTSLTQSLRAGVTESETFEVTSFDGSANEFIAITIDGRNDEATIFGDTSAVAVEDFVGDVGGALSIEDADQDEAAFVAQTDVPGNQSFGWFSVDENGTWTYELNQEAVQFLGEDVRAMDSFVVASLDGTALAELTVEIAGTNDTAAISGVLSSETHEDEVDPITGVVTVVDLDESEDQLIPQQEVAGSYGRFSVTADGSWTYVLNSAEAQELQQNESAEEIFSVESVDHTAIENVAITIAGRNDTPTDFQFELVETQVDEGGLAEVTGSFVDVDLNDSHSVVIDWGDGSSTTESLDGSESHFRLTHAYSQDGEFLIQAAVTDFAGATAEATASVTVINVNPAVDPLVLDATCVDEYGMVTLSGMFSDPGTHDAHKLGVDWGDGAKSFVNLSADTRSFSISHQYFDDDPTASPNDTYTITATVDDFDGGRGQAAIDVTVENVAPRSATLILQDAQIDENGFAILQGQFEDPGLFDTHSVEIVWGDGSSELVSVGGVESLFDSQFALSDWNFDVVEYGNGGTTTATQTDSTRRRVEITLNDPPTNGFSQVAAFNAFDQQLDISAIGGVTAIDFEFDAFDVSTESADELTMKAAIRQDGQWFATRQLGFEANGRSRRYTADDFTLEGSPGVQRRGFESDRTFNCKYRHQKSRDLAVVRIDGKDHYLGLYDSPESHQEYHRLIAEWLRRQTPKIGNVQNVSVCELILRFIRRRVQAGFRNSTRSRSANAKLRAIYLSSSSSRLLPANGPHRTRFSYSFDFL